MVLRPRRADLAGSVPVLVAHSQASKPFGASLTPSAFVAPGKNVSFGGDHAIENVLG
jgi:hypothetical protein